MEFVSVHIMWPKYVCDVCAEHMECTHTLIHVIHEILDE